MRYRLTAALLGDLRSPERHLSSEREGFTFELLADTSGRITKAAVSVAVPQERVPLFAGSAAPGRGQALVEFTVGGDPQLHESLVDQLQRLESELAMSTNGALWRIAWDNPEKEFIPENDEEQALIAISSLSYEVGYPREPALITSERYQQFIATSHWDRALQVPKAFWREGMNSFRTFRYVQAFYWFYFVIEAFFAKGKSAEGAVIKEFAKSEELRQLSEYSFRALGDDPRHMPNILRLFNDLNIEPTSAMLPLLLVRLRGRLHHFNPRSPRLQPTPFNQSEFETPALVLMLMASHALADRAPVILFPSMRPR
jgi:hypothetical protein